MVAGAINTIDLVIFSPHLSPSGTSPAVGMQVWLKHDLRLDDNPGLQDALQETSQIVPAFCMDPKLYVHLQRTPNGVPGAHTASSSDLNSAEHVSGQQVMWSGHGGFPGSFWAAEGQAPCIGRGQLPAWKVI